MRKESVTCLGFTAYILDYFFQKYLLRSVLWKWKLPGEGPWERAACACGGAGSGPGLGAAAGPASLVGAAWAVTFPRYQARGLQA